MKRLNLSTKMKAAVGYAAVIALFLAAVGLIVGVLDSLTRSDGAERTINNRQRATNDVVSRLYQAEVIGQALSAGQTDLFQAYVDAMMLTARSVDSLRAIVVSLTCCGLLSSFEKASRRRPKKFFRFL